MNVEKNDNVVINIKLKSLKSKSYDLNVNVTENLFSLFQLIENTEPVSLGDCTLLVTNQKGKIKRIKVDKDGEKLIGEFLEEGDKIDVTIDFKSACASGGKKCELKK